MATKQASPGLIQRQRAFERMEAEYGPWLALARHQAARLAFERGEITTDDLQALADLPQEDRLYLPHPPHHNAWGAVISQANDRSGRRIFRPTGKFLISRRPEARGRRIQSWVLAR